MPGFSGRTKISKTFFIYVFLTWLALLGLCLLFPYTGDDWAWGSSIGTDRLAAGFANYNGRYLGNLIVLVLTRNYVLRSIIVSLTLVSIALLVTRLTGKWRISTYSIMLILLLGCPDRIAAQSYVWTAGYSNYATTALLSLIYLNCCLPILKSTRRQSESSRTIVFMCLLGLANSLILETATIMSVAMGVCFVLYARKNCKYWSRAQIAFTLGAIIGAILMFSNGGYWNTLEGTDDYRSLPESPLSQIVDRLTDTIPTWMIANCWLVLLVIVFCLVYWALNNRENLRNYALRDQMPLIALLATSTYALACSIYCSFIAQTTAGDLRNTLVAISMFGMLAALIWLGVSKCCTYSGKLWLTLILAIVILIAPLAIVNPIGPRNFFLPYVLECVFACLLWTWIVKDQTLLSTLLLIAVLLFSYLNLLSIFSEVHTADVKRNELVREAVQNGEKSVAVKALPHDNYLQVPNPKEGTWEYRYKLFYGIPDEFEIEF